MVDENIGVKMSSDIYCVFFSLKLMNETRLF
jgi:hypothetical protein